ncbi:MAG: hypothetical protein HQK79_08980 [Desulfobacterales bacterium]|nr:hypothetical protein [Desulfobacterales bacterium]MBF0397571.1 hypothetical protein [Desulfobacterales bacterium]
MQASTQKQTLKITPVLKKEIIKIIDKRIEKSNLAKKDDLSEIKKIVREIVDIQKKTDVTLTELAEAQKRTEVKVEELAEAQKETKKSLQELAEAQKRTEVKVEELAEAQKETKKSLQELAEAQKETAIEVKELSKGLRGNRSEIGGLSRSMSYALENEAFRVIPKVLKEKYNIEILEKFVREEIRNKEINIFGRGKKDGEELIIVGEAKLRLDERRIKKGEDDDVFTELKEHVETVQQEYPNIKVIKLFITHYATKGFLRKAKEENIIVIQSFEW